MFCAKFEPKNPDSLIFVSAAACCSQARSGGGVRQAGRQTDLQTDRHTDRNRQIYKKTKIRFRDSRWQGRIITI